MADANIPGFTASPELERKLNALDDNLNPITKELVENEDDTTEETTEENETVDEVEEKQEVNESEETNDDSEESNNEEDGYTIDDESDEDDEEEIVIAETPTKTETVARSDMTPEQQYLYDNIPPLKVRGRIGQDGDIQEFTVYSPEHLPENFYYVDQREMSIANKAFSVMENKAVELTNQFRSQENSKAAQQFKELEDNADRSDINQLQKEGELPKFKTAPDDPKFEEDSGVKLVQEILDFKETLNNRYMEEYNAGRPYRHLGFQEAYAMYRRQHPKIDPKVQAEDNERTNIARRTSNTKSRAMESKPKVSPGMSSRDLDLYLENLDI